MPDLKLPKLPESKPFYLPERTFECTEKNTIVESTHEKVAEAVYAALIGQRRDAVERSIEMDKSRCKSDESIRDCKSITAKEFRHLLAKFVASMAVQSVHKEGQIDTNETECFVSEKEYTKTLTGAKLMYDGIITLLEGIRSYLSPKKTQSCECVCSN